MLYTTGCKIEEGKFLKLVLTLSLEHSILLRRRYDNTFHQTQSKLEPMSTSFRAPPPTFSQLVREINNVTK